MKCAASSAAITNSNSASRPRPASRSPVLTANLRPLTSEAASSSVNAPTLDARAIPDEKRWQYANTITLTLRNHIIKSGFDFSHVNTLRDDLLYEEGGYNYAGINDFIIDYANFAAAGALRAEGRVCSNSARIAGQCYIGGYNQAFGRAAFGFTTNDYSFFVQDDYRLSSRMTLNLGLRYEYQQLPKPQPANPLSNLLVRSSGRSRRGAFPPTRTMSSRGSVSPTA